MAKQLFFVTALSKSGDVRAKIAEVIPDEGARYELAPDKWVVSYDGVAIDLAQKIGIRGDPHVGTGIVTTFGSYAGRAPSAFWEWLKTQAE